MEFWRKPVPCRRTGNRKCPRANVMNFQSIQIINKDRRPDPGLLDRLLVRDRKFNESYYYYRKSTDDYIR